MPGTASPAVSHARRARKAPLRSLTDTAYLALKEEILNNRIAPGEPIPKERLVRQLGLSRTPLREAILRLEKEGFIEVHPRMGTFAAHLDLRQIHEMYEVRRALEAMAARQVAGRLDPAKLDAVEQDLRRQPPDASGAAMAALSEAGQKLHRLIVESSGNRVLAGFIQSLQDHFRRYRSLSLTIPEKVLSSHQEHLAILESLKRGDGAEAERLVHLHFDHAARYLLDSLLRSPLA